jgi:hypothetical protein
MLVVAIAGVVVLVRLPATLRHAAAAAAQASPAPAPPATAKPPVTR